MSNTEIKNKVDYVLIDARCVMKDVPVVPSFNRVSDHRMLRAIIHLISAPVKRKLNVSSLPKRPTENDEELV